VRIGIDLGGTKIEGIVLDDEGRERRRRRAATPRDDYPGTLQAVAAILHELERGLPAVPAVGIGSPGSPSRLTGRMKNCNSTWLNGRPLAADLERVLGRPVRLANDADCFALSEATDGAGAGASSVFGVILGTGVGGGIVIDGRLLTGVDGLAGEWGHNPLPWPAADELPGPACYCGRAGCIETWISGPGLAADHRRVAGQALGARQIASAARRGDAAARSSLERYETRLARGLASVINILDPECIVLGGGLSALRRLYRELPALLADYVFSDRVAARLSPPRHGDASGVRGAARLWPG